VELSHTWKSQITTTINYSNVKDIIQEVVQQKGQEAYNMPANVSSLTQFGISVNANTPVTKWWSSNINVNVYNDNYKGLIGTTSIDRSATSFIFNTAQQFKITKTFSAEVNGRYRNGWLEGVMRVRPVGFVGAGLSQQIWKNKGTIRLTARDIFYTQKLKGVTQYGNVDFEMNQVAETQVITIGFTYSFSKGKKLAPVKRTAGSSNEEQGRIGQ
ncbi:MAG: outer membrane beta-barrel family protein, partial [Bacteroidota bacterium]|nr:outer membrane beta-barrel family protein [Bacteroidota bacterium]